jgi:hypothetical protein
MQSAKFKITTQNSLRQTPFDYAQDRQDKQNTLSFTLLFCTLQFKLCANKLQPDSCFNKEVSV